MHFSKVGLKLFARFALAGTAVLSVFVAKAVQGADEAGPERWESQIAAFEQQDREEPPQQGGVVFVGSSSIRKWKLDESFPDQGYINRGFGGSEIADSTHFAERIIFPHSPKIVVLYAGDNDIGRGKSAEQVAADFHEFAVKVHKQLPDARILFLAVKPSLARWQLYPRMQEANRLIAEECRRDEHLAFIDIAAPMLGDDGQPREELFVEDGLHLSPAGYKLWSKVLAPHLR